MPEIIILRRQSRSGIQSVWLQILANIDSPGYSTELQFT